MKKTSMTLINEKLKGFFDLENFDPSLSSMRNNQTIKSHQAKNKKTKTKKSMKTGQNNQNSKTFSFLHSDTGRFYQLGKKEKKRKEKEIKNK
jgi:hypothetical protein